MTLVRLTTAGLLITGAAGSEIPRVGRVAGEDLRQGMPDVACGLVVSLPIRISRRVRGALDVASPLPSVPMVHVAEGLRPIAHGHPERLGGEDPSPAREPRNRLEARQRAVSGVLHGVRCLVPILPCPDQTSESARLRPVTSCSNAPCARVLPVANRESSGLPGYSSPMPLCGVPAASPEQCFAQRSTVAGSPRRGRESAGLRESRHRFGDGPGRRGRVPSPQYGAVLCRS